MPCDGEYVQRTQTKSGRFRHLIWLGILLVGCAASPHPRAGFEGASAPAPYATEDWSFHNAKGKVLTSAHYKIYTTIEQPDIQQALVQVAEGGLSQYEKLAPGVAVTNKPMECYIFANKGQWIQFTKERLGPAAQIYLKINRGGSPVPDWYVGHYSGEAATYMVGAHEGWHQFVSRHFKGRLPPFLEEGIATMFEDMDWRKDLPMWNIAVNRSRLESLRRVADR